MQFRKAAGEHAVHLLGKGSFEVEGPQAGLQALDSVAKELEEYHLLHAARADFLRRSGRRAEAAAGYRRALELVTNESERRYLERRLEEVHGAR